MPLPFTLIYFVNTTYLSSKEIIRHAFGGSSVQSKLSG